MIQGTMSGAGKSIITAGLIRVLIEDGFRAAPFKSQNMALNSFVTADGREMGRAQVVQAAAACMEPSSDMNPVLIKPMGDTTSQIIVNGRPVGNMTASEYFGMKRKLIPDILASYERLSEKADVIIMEGAGSPVEINLRDNDIVNMGLAALVDAPVMIVGNIDPGGVFAQLLGTYELLEKKERERVRGFIINRFRGDKSLLMPGLKQFGDYCPVPFAGVVPFMDLDLDDEDSVSCRLANRFKRDDGEEDIRIAVVKLPFISNHSDFTVFYSLPFAGIYYASSPEELEGADLIILPGTKNTIRDLEWLKRSGMKERILAEAKKGTLIIGICGGFQMLGERISDPDLVEGGGSAEGLSLLPVSTIFSENKTQKQVKTVLGDPGGEFSLLSGAKIRGYEIHMGVMEGEEISPVTVNGNVLGTYIHGFFDPPELLGKLFKILFRRKGIEREMDLKDPLLHMDNELNRLAEVLRDNLDMDLIYRAIGL